MAGQDDIRRLGEEWSALADTFLETDEGLRLKAEWTNHERPIAVSILKSYADLLPEADQESKKHFSGQRRKLHHAGLTALEQIFAGLGKDAGAARSRMVRLRAMVADAAETIEKRVICSASPDPEGLLTRSFEFFQGQAFREPQFSEAGATDRDTIQVPEKLGHFLMEVEDQREEEDKPTCIPQDYSPENYFEVGRAEHATDPAICHVSKFQASLPPPLELEDGGRPSFAELSLEPAGVLMSPLPEIKDGQPADPVFREEEMATGVREETVDVDQLREWEYLEGKNR